MQECELRKEPDRENIIDLIYISIDCETALLLSHRVCICENRSFFSQSHIFCARLRENRDLAEVRARVSSDLCRLFCKLFLPAHRLQLRKIKAHHGAGSVFPELFDREPFKRLEPVPEQGGQGRDEKRLSETAGTREENLVCRCDEARDRPRNQANPESADFRESASGARQKPVRVRLRSFGPPLTWTPSFRSRPLKA